MLVVLDGMGLRFLERQAPGFLAGKLAGTMTSVFPSTTASAVTTFATGASPLEHGVTGWFTYLRELGSVSKILFSQPRHGGGSYRAAGFGMDRAVMARSLYDRLRAKSFVVTPSEIVQGDFAMATSGRAVLLGFQGLPGFCLGIRRALESRPGPTFVSAYWPGLDSLCHRHGVGSRQVREHFLELDAALRQLCGRHAGGDTLFVITADHGLVDTPRSRCLDPGEHPDLARCLTLPLCGEPRLAYCYVHPDREGDFRRIVSTRLTRACLAVPGSELIAKGFYGPGRPPDWFRHRVGDYVLAMRDGWTMRDRLPTEDKFQLRAGHGGLTPDEMLVPLVLSD